MGSASSDLRNAETNDNVSQTEHSNFSGIEFNFLSMDNLAFSTEDYTRYSKSIQFQYCNT
jgi:hypothetical protein